MVYYPGHNRMKNKNRVYEDGDEFNPDRTTPRSRMFARMKREILMKLEREIELLERETEERQVETTEKETGEFNSHGNEDMKEKEMFDDHKNSEKEREQEWSKEKENRDAERGTKDEDMKGLEIEDHQKDEENDEEKMAVATEKRILAKKRKLQSTSDVKMKKRRMQKPREQKRKKGYPDLATTVSDKRRKTATEDRLATERLLATKNRLATERFSGTELALTTVQRLSATKREMNNNITILGITKQFLADLWTHYDKFKEKAFYHRRRRDESLRMLSLGDGISI
ncbi:DNA ligase 1-like [Helianthus annuus]|uniref:DNA ligase 1-like n=1 Tax=Helianthus annuus TaxID=4232 RepID=UPI000B8F3687|nr:DNA ligase 1-like [Helianthus annuus]